MKRRAFIRRSSVARDDGGPAAVTAERDSLTGRRRRPSRRAPKRGAPQEEGGRGAQRSPTTVIDAAHPAIRNGRFRRVGGTLVALVALFPLGRFTAAGGHKEAVRKLRGEGRRAVGRWRPHC